MGPVSRPAVLVAVAVVAVVVVSGLLLSGIERESAPAAEVPQAAAIPTPRETRQVASSTGIPRRALTAYVRAARTIERDDATCRIAWNTLAGIGASESSHGAFGGAALDGRGVARPLIIGVPLDGSGGNRAIRDTDGGRLDGDVRWDRAVGPMQFIPTTWEVWGADGDLDDRSDPHDLDDAALAAGRYLCRAGTDLSGSEGWSRAVLTYNNSGQYARKVARTATAYAQAVDDM
jgi:membrane-bound lytic murein transglycosylase B